MSKNKKLYLLLGIFAAVLLAIFIISRVEDRQEEIETTDKRILEIDYDDVTALSWDYETELSFTKEDGTWKYDEDADFPVSEEKMQSLLSDFESFQAAFVIKDATDLSQYGLDDPEATIQLTAGDTDYTIELGGFSTMDSERYVSIGDGNVYLVESDPLDDFDLELGDMLQNDELPDMTDATELSFTGPEDYTITYDEDADASLCADDVYFTDGKPLDTDNVTSYLNTLANLDQTDFVTYKVTDEELSAYGFDDPALTVEVTYTATDEDGKNEEEKTFRLTVGENVEELAKAEETASKKDTEIDMYDVTTYFRVGDSPIIYQLTTTAYENLMAMTYNDLRHQDLMTASCDDFSQIDITIDGESYTLTAKDKLGGSKVWSLADADDSDEAEDTDGAEDADDEKDADDEDAEIDMTDFETALTALSATEFTDDKASGKEEVSLTIHLDDKQQSTLSIALYRKDGDTCTAYIDGTPTALVDRSQAVDLIEAINAIVL